MRRSTILPRIFRSWRRWLHHRRTILRVHPDDRDAVREAFREAIAESKLLRIDLQELAKVAPPYKAEPLSAVVRLMRALAET